jgi:hypothetical protein
MIRSLCGLSMSDCSVSANRPALFTKASTTIAATKISTHCGNLFWRQDHQRALDLASAVAAYLDAARLAVSVR